MAERLTPKYLTKELVEQVVNLVLDAFLLDPKMEGILKRNVCHTVVLAPSVKDAREADYPDWPNYPVTPVAIYEKSVGKAEWEHPFDSIARCKAQQLWYGQNTDGNMDCNAHLLYSGDTPYYGGVKRHGIVVACSGLQPYFDQMLSGMIADGLKAFARHAYEESDDKKKGGAFLT